MKSKDSVLLLDETGARHLAESFVNGKWTIAKVEKQNKKSRPSPPFITSSLQQEGNRKLGLPARETMRTAQTLYERGLITYMRTDSVNLSNESLTATKKWLTENLGAAYSAQAPRTFKIKSRMAQEAHEAIRPTNVGLTPEKNGIEEESEEEPP